MRVGLLLALLFSGVLAVARRAEAQTYPPPPILKDGTALLLQDYATAPLSGRGGSITDYGPHVDLDNQLSRINFMRFEPPDAPLASMRFFVPDLNRNLYIVDKATKTFTPYINFQSVFPRFGWNSGSFSVGLITLAFEPGYSSNGLFYTVHMEFTSGNAFPTNSNLPGFNTNGYALTSPTNPPLGGPTWHSVLIEWRDTNVANATFEGTARELLRLGYNQNFHFMGDLIFNPLAGPGHPDYRNLYISVGDGGSGEMTLSLDGQPGVTAGDPHNFPQRLDTYVGKILRITPDLNLRPGDLLSGNGRYRIPSTGPDPNPFVNTNGARAEIYALGFRNCHRLSWDVISDRLIESDIGLYTFEEVNLIVKGGNYGYADREGTRGFFPLVTGAQPPGVNTFPIPNPDLISLRLNATVTNLAQLTPIYPVAEYYQGGEGDGMANGYVYRGTLMPRLQGKYIFGDITTGRLFYSDLGEMIAAFDTNPATLAAVHEVQIVFDSPDDLPDQGAVKRRMFDIVADEYTRRGGNASPDRLPGGATATDGSDLDGIPYGGGRADLRLALGDDNEIYVITKSDGMIRQLVAVVAPPVIESIQATNGTVTLTWQTIQGQNYRVQYVSSLLNSNWTDLAGDILATNTLASKTDMLVGTNRFYRVYAVP